MSSTISWKTSVAGSLAAVGTLLAGLPDSGQPAWLKIVGLILAILGTLGVGVLAKDHSATDPNSNPLNLDPTTAATVKTEVEALVAAVVAAKTKANTPAPPPVPPVA